MSAQKKAVALAFDLGLGEAKVLFPSIKSPFVRYLQTKGVDISIESGVEEANEWITDIDRNGFGRRLRAVSAQLGD